VKVSAGRTCKPKWVGRQGMNKCCRPARQASSTPFAVAARRPEPRVVGEQTQSPTGAPPVAGRRYATPRVPVANRRASAPAAYARPRQQQFNVPPCRRPPEDAPQLTRQGNAREASGEATRPASERHVPPMLTAERASQRHALINSLQCPRLGQPCRVTHLFAVRK